MSRPNELLAVQILTVIRFMFCGCLCCGVMLAAFLCPVIVVEFHTIFILVFTLYYMFCKVFK